jgi:zinc transport system ATP-binding protein
LIGLIPHEGEIRWAPDARIGYVPQKLDLERDLPLTAMDLLSAQARIAKRDRSAVDEVTATVDFPEAMRARPIARLSGGHFQRLLVACALLGSPTVLLLLGWAEIEVREGPSGTVELTVPTGHRHGMKPT